MDCEADLIGRLANDLDGDGGRGGGPLSRVATVGEGFRDEGERSTREPQQEGCAITVLNVGGLGLQDEAAPVRVDHDLALAALHLLARIVAARAAALGRLDALAVEHDG